ncbi:hypothetical protein QVD17_12424 [Tagetes erecta]|uniref:Uncharacterized protein n=1 Tax=Tagetes erecta TaxID=13708 RepID=A0AAD8KUV1_TARER|nr:hypothetical protein QVD17_12424 [Tagetes erecta]
MEVKQVTDSAKAGSCNNKNKKSGGKGKFQKANVSNSRKEMPSLRTRSSPKALWEGIKVLSDDQRKAVKSMGFGRLLSFNVNGVPGGLAFYVVDKLDTKTMSIEIESGSVSITKERIHQLLGVPNGGDDFVAEGVVNATVSKMWRRVYGISEISPANIVNRLRTYTVADWLFRIDFVMLFITTMIDCQKNGKCKTSIMPVFTESRDISKLDWCSLIYSNIHECKDNWVKDDPDSYFTGPLTILMLMYVDATTCNDMQVDRRDYALAEWNMSKLRERQNIEFKNGGFGVVKKQDLFVAGEDIDEGEFVAEVNMTEQSPSKQELVSKLKGLISSIEKEKNEFEKMKLIAAGKYSDDQELMCLVKEYYRMVGMMLLPVSSLDPDRLGLEWVASRAL